NDTLRILYCC
ncbi:hypothetical protein D039_3546B, partial [Vibrio parahaemolyticus EKP-028]